MHWNRRGGNAVPAPALVALAPGDGLDAESWAQNEFGGGGSGTAKGGRTEESKRRLQEAPIGGAASGTLPPSVATRAMSIFRL